jgi:WD40 repeat protein
LVRDLATGKELLEVGGNVAARWLDFSPDSKRLIAAGPHRELLMWDVAKGAPAEEFKLVGIPVTAFAFAPSGDTLVVAMATGELALLDAHDGKQMRRLKEPGNVTVSQSFMPNGKAFYSVMGYVDLISALAISRDGKRVAAVSQDRSVRIWDAGTGKLVVPSDGVRSPVKALAFTPDGKGLVAVGADQRVRTWEPRTGKLLHEHAFPAADPLGLCLSAGGQLYAFRDVHDRVIRMRSTAPGREKEQTVPENNLRPVMAMGLNLDGTLLATTTFGGIEVWETATGNPVETLAHSDRRVMPSAVTLSADGRFLAIGDVGMPSIFDRGTRRWLPALQGRPSGTGMPVFSPDRRSLFAKSYQGKIFQWECLTGRFRAPLIEAPTNVSALAVSPDGRTLVSACFNHVIYLWDAATGEPAGELSAQQGDVRTLAFSPDGKLLASGSEDSTIIIWQLTAAPKRAISSRPPKDMESLWHDLAGNGVMRAYRGVHSLTQCGDEAVAFLAGKLKPAKGATAQQVIALIAQLDSEDFALRAKASEELEKIGDGLRPFLRRALAANPGLEGRRRLEQLLAQPPKTAMLSPEQIGKLRGLEVLESLATPVARRLLASLAGGAVSDPLTGAAVEASERVAVRAKIVEVRVARSGLLPWSNRFSRPRWMRVIISTPTTAPSNLARQKCSVGRRATR